jgi:hypothetical protein
VGNGRRPDRDRFRRTARRAQTPSAILSRNLQKTGTKFWDVRSPGVLVLVNGQRVGAEAALPPSLADLGVRPQVRHRAADARSDRPRLPLVRRRPAPPVRRRPRAAVHDDGVLVGPDSVQAPRHRLHASLASGEGRGARPPGHRLSDRHQLGPGDQEVAGCDEKVRRGALREERRIPQAGGRVAGLPRVLPRHSPEVPSGQEAVGELEGQGRRHERPEDHPTGGRVATSAPTYTTARHRG